VHEHVSRERERRSAAIARRKRVRVAGAAAIAVAAAHLLPAQTPSPPTAVPGTDERLQRVQERRAALERDLAKLRGQERSLLGEVERLDLEVRLRNEQIRETQLVLQRTNQEMDSTVKRLRALEATIERTRPVLAARARALYKLGDLSYLRLLLSVEKPADVFRGYRLVTTIARRDKEQISGFRSDLQSQRAARAELEEKTRQVLALRAELDRSRRALDSDRSRKTKLLTEIVDKKETHAAYVAELQEAEARLGRMLGGLAAGEVSVPIPAFRGALAWPVAGRVRVPFGLRKHARFDTYTVQNGIEIEAPVETAVQAVHEGSVVFAEHFRGYGLMVVIDHGGKHHSLYAHMGDVRVQPGQKVRAGDVLGSVGASGLEGAGLYFEMRFQGKPQDPLGWLRPN
jgi:septal ring factor EnvC (AmiA/AmiB activator)